MTTLAGAALAERAALVLSVPLQAALGTRLLDPGDPQAGVRFEIGELADGGAGGAHAGALGVGLEVAALLVVLPHLTVDEHAVSVSTATAFPAQAPAGRPVEFRGTLDRRTGRTAFTSAVATCDGVPVARAQIVKAVVRVPGAQPTSSRA